MKEFIIGIFLIIFLGIGLFIGISINSKYLVKPILNNTTDTIIENGDVWYSIQDSTNKIEWRHIRNSNDTMSVIHIHQGDSLYTWIGKPCNCY